MSGANPPRTTWWSGVAVAALLALALPADLRKAPPAIGDEPPADRASASPASLAGAWASAAAEEPQAPPVPVLCFAPGTDPAVVQREAQRRSMLTNSLSPSGSMARHQFSDSSRWTMTATDGYVPTQGQPITLTWSIVPDGTSIGSFGGEPTSGSNLIAFLNAHYGSPSGWLPIVQEVFDRWSELAGITYVYEPHDDGAAFPSSPGQLGVRGDVRLSGHAIDGDYGVLAYNFFPNYGDMVIDTSDVWFNDTSTNWLRIRNVMAHEHGHGLGMQHTCPIDSTKLMEPYASLAFDGPQHDDILAGNRGYGDPLENNDTPATATNLGTLGNGTTELDGLSIDDDSDLDHFAFAVASGKVASVTVTPVGHTYLNGPQNSDGSCTAGTDYDTLNIADLSVQLLAGDGTTVLATAASNPAGVAEALSGVALPGAGTYYVKVYGGSALNAQLYDLSLTIGDPPAKPDKIFNSGFEAPTLAGWSSSATGSGDLTLVAGGAIMGTQSLVATIDGGVLYVQDDTPSAEPRYRARFYLDPSGFAASVDGSKATLFMAYSNTPSPMQKTVAVMLRLKNGAEQVMAKVHVDSGIWISTPWQTLPSGASSVELDWQQASGPAASDGHLTLWVNGGTPQTRSGLANANRSIDSVRLGILTSTAGSTGALRFDAFASRRSSYIGP